MRQHDQRVALPRARMLRACRRTQSGVYAVLGAKGTFLRVVSGGDGSNLLEYAIIFIVLMMMIFGIAGFGQLLYSYHFVSHAAREAARFAMVNGQTCNNDAVAGSGGAGGSPGSCTAPVSCSSGSCSECTSYGSCAPATKADIQNYVKMITPGGINSGAVATTAVCGVSDVSTACTSSVPTICRAAVGTPAEGPYPNYPGCTVEVQVQYTFNFVFPLIRTSSMTLTSTSEMVIAH